MSQCTSCGAAILWLKQIPTDKNPDPKANPIDAKGSPDGNLVISREDGLYRFATGNEKEIAKNTGKNLYMSHFATCPDRDKFRRKS